MGYDLSSRNIPFFIVVLLFETTGILTLLARGYVRTRLMRALGWDDRIMVLAMITFSAFTGAAIVGIERSSSHGGHLWDLAPDEARDSYLSWWINYIAYSLTITLARLSVGFFFLRITGNKQHHYIVYLLMFLNVVAGLIFLGVVSVQCLPVPYYWNKVYPHAVGNCIPIRVFISLGYLYGAVCATIDFSFALLPIYILWDVHVSKRTKLALIPVLGLAGAASCAPLVRMAYLHHLRDTDWLYANVPVAVWSTTEMGLIVVASNLATLKPLYWAMTGQDDKYTSRGRTSEILAPRSSALAMSAGDSSVHIKSTAHVDAYELFTTPLPNVVPRILDEVTLELGTGAQKSPDVQRPPTPQVSLMSSSRQSFPSSFRTWTRSTARGDSYQSGGGSSGEQIVSLEVPSPVYMGEATPMIVGLAL